MGVEMNEIEETFIGSILEYPRNYDIIAGKFKSEFLEDELARDIFENYEYDILEISKKTGIDIKELLRLCMSGETGIYFKIYAEKIVQDWKDREKAIILSNPLDDEEINKLSELNSFNLFEQEENINESDEFLKTAEQRYKNEPDTRTILTGFNNLDKYVKGFRKSEAIFIGGRPGSGKTTFGMNLAYNMASNGYKVLFCSLEMSKIELHERIIKSVTKINNFYKMTSADFEKIIKESKFVKENLPLEIYDKAGMKMEDILEKSKEKKYDIIFIDHLAILTSTRGFKSRYEEVSYLSGRIKALARELDIPIVCLCQLNRALESRTLKAPTMADIRDSGSVEQDGDLIGFIYRPEYHLKDQEPDNKNSQEYDEWEKSMKLLKGKAYLILAKNRRGCTGKYNFIFDGENYKFTECE